MDWTLLYYIVPAVIGLAGLVAIIVIYARKIPQLKALDLEAMPEHRQRLKKNLLIQDRFSRKMTRSKTVLKSIVLPVLHAVEKIFKGTYQRLLKLEEHYKATASASLKGDDDSQQHSASTLIQQANSLLTENKFAEAEKQYIAAITLNRSATEAYRGLVKIYLQQKNTSHAIETLRFLTQLDSSDETAWQDLAQVYQESGKLEDALDAYEQALKASPNNPKNLDAYIEVAILNKLKYKAQSALDRFTAVNPENNKLADYQKQIDAL